MTEVKTKGWGMLYISREVFPYLGKPETPEQWHKALLLPDTFEVVNINMHHQKGIELIVLSDEIKVDDAHILQVEVAPQYRRNGDVVELMSIYLYKWDGEVVKAEKIEYIKPDEEAPIYPQCEIE